MNLENKKIILNKKIRKMRKVKRIFVIISNQNRLIKNVKVIKIINLKQKKNNLETNINTNNKKSSGNNTKNK